MTIPSSYFISRQRLSQEVIWNIIAHPTLNKLYVGGIISGDPERKNLNVIDLTQYPEYEIMQKGVQDVSVSLQVGRKSSVLKIAISIKYNKIYALIYEVVQETGRSTATFLSIYNLNINGDISGNVTSYPLSKTGYLVDKTDINLYDSFVIHPSLPLIYVTDGQDILVYDLDANNFPVIAGAKKFNIIKDRMYCLAIHDNGKKLYAGHSNGGFVVATLDATGKNVLGTQDFKDNPYAGNSTWGPLGNPDLFFFHYTAKAIYRSIDPSDISGGHRNFPLHVWPLDANGDILKPAANPTEYNQAKEFKNILWDNESFFPTTTDIYCTQPVFFNDALTGEKRIGSFSLQKFPLDANGFPQTDALGNPTGGKQIIEFDDEEPYMLRLTSAQIPLVLTRAFLHQYAKPPNIVPQVPGALQVKGHFLKCTVISSNPPVNNNWSIKATAYVATTAKHSDTIKISPLSLSVVFSLDKILLFPDIALSKQQVKISFELIDNVANVAPQNVTYKLEYFDIVPAVGVMPKKTLIDSVYGNRLYCLIDSYSYQSNSPKGRFDRFNLLSTQWNAWAIVAGAVAISSKDLPKKFILSAYSFDPEQAHENQVKSMTQWAQSFGFNTFLVNDTVTQVCLKFPEGTNVLHNNGIDKFMGAESYPLHNYAPTNNLPYFDFYLESPPDPSKNLNVWVNDSIIGASKDFGGIDLLMLAMADEFGFIYLNGINDLHTKLRPPGSPKPPYLDIPYFEIFRNRWHAYLAGNLGLTVLDIPGFFGKPDWNSVTPPTAVPDPIAAKDADNRKLYYWAVRFFQICIIRGFNDTILALEKVFPNLKYCYVNLNEFYGWRVITKDVNNKDVDTKLLDWFEIGRSGNQVLWSEGSDQDNNVWEWSFITDLLVSAANSSHSHSLKNIPIGSYIKGLDLGTHPAGALYKTFALISRNAKALIYYSQGAYHQDGDSWVDNTAIYKPITDGTKLLGKVENFIYDAAPKRGKVALFTSAASWLWDAITNINDFTYNCDLKGIYASFLHEGYSIDFIDDGDIEAGFLTQRDYKILYITAPNLSSKSYAEIDNWVNKNGGCLVVTQGAGMFDEYNTPTDALDIVLGVKNRVLYRETVLKGHEFPFEATHNLKAASPAFTPLPPNLKLWLDKNKVGNMASVAASPLYSLDTGELMITQYRYGAGNAFCYNFLPGVQYLNAGYRIKDISTAKRNIALMDKWRDEYRLLAMLPIARLATQGINIGSWKLVDLNQKMVEAVVMESTTGIAIVLFNWNNSIVNDLIINLPMSNSYLKVSSAQGSSIKNLVIQATSIQFTLSSLQYVDVIMIW